MELISANIIWLNKNGLLMTIEYNLG